jgi:methyl-accepting chemotaxis protein
MKIRQKLLLGASVLTLVPLLLTAWLLWQGAVNLSENTVNAQVHTQLQALRDLKAQQVREELESRMAAVRALAQNRTTLEAMQRLREGFHTTARDLPQFRRDLDSLHRDMQTYIDQSFTPEFRRRNPGPPPRLNASLSTRSADATLLQHIYIAANPFPLGQKERLTALAEPRFNYGELHARYHPSMERAQKLLGLYDIFLIDTSTDEVIYTVFKELDFGSRLSDGLAAGSKLAEAYAKVKNAKGPQDIYLSDFQPYLPSYNDQAAFVAVPLFEGERQIGVMVVQYPIDKINAAMSSDNAWMQIGLGRTGDVFLVGADYRMRSNARAMSETSQRGTYLRQLEGQLDAQHMGIVKAKQSTIGLVHIENDATRAALADQNNGVVRLVDHRGVPVVAAFAPLNIAGQQWAVIAQIDAAEADEPLQELNQDLGWRTLGLAVLMLVGVGGAMVWVARHIVWPISRLHDTVQAVAAGHFDARCQVTQTDEIGQLGQAFDQLLDERIASLHLAVQENDQLHGSVIALMQTVYQLSEKDLAVRAHVGDDAIGSLASSINQLAETMGRTLKDVRGIADQVRTTADSVEHEAAQVSQTVQAEHQALDRMGSNLQQATEQLRHVARLSETSNRAAEQATHATHEALHRVVTTEQGMAQLREVMAETEQRFQRLSERSQDISTVVTLIGTFADRTHMLAINAAMQAATAGEAGRGFTVVAEEVQRLAESSRQATQQVTQLVNSIQTETLETVTLMHQLIAQTTNQSEQAHQAGMQMDEARRTTVQLVQWVQQIASSSEQQTQLAHALQEGVQQLNRGSHITQQVIERQRVDTMALANASRRLADAVAQFRLPTA